MTAKALGVIEAIGLAAAIEAGDAAAKAANVVLLGYENARGGGRITVKLVGDVGAVKAAVAAGSAAALRVGKVDGCIVIPRPHEEIEALIAKIDRGRPARTPPLPPTPAPASPPAPQPEPVALAEPLAAPEPAPVAVAEAQPAPVAVAEAQPEAVADPGPAPKHLAPPAPEKDRPAASRRPKQARRAPAPGSGEVEGQ